MLFMQLTAAQGPAECEQAVKFTYQQLLADAKQQQIELTRIEEIVTPAGYASILLQAKGEQLEAWSNTWCGSIQWTFQSPFRPQHKRKNWFIGITAFKAPKLLPADDSIRFQACRATGSGGQHVNTTDSAVHATHIATGISVKVMTERSQHANKQRACELIALKLQQYADEAQADQKLARHIQHGQVERGNPIRRFKR